MDLSAGDAEVGARHLLASLVDHSLEQKRQGEHERYAELGRKKPTDSSPDGSGDPEGDPGEPERRPRTPTR
jgi:hypothetical protein